MTMKKKILTTLSVVLILGLAALGILAYLQDDDSDVNVMTLGNVSIDQIEQERIDTSMLPTADNNLKKFKDKPVYPAVYEGSSIPYDNESKEIPGWKVVEDNDNVIDKFITVKNDGKSDAYVRTIIAFEVGKEAVNDPYMHLVCNGNNKDGYPWTYEWVVENGEEVVVEIDGGYYKLCVFTHNDILPVGETTIPSVKQLYLDKSATNEVCEAYGDAFKLLALSQAGQVAGFESVTADSALDTMFGEVTAAKAIEWFTGLKAEIDVENNAEMATAITYSGVINVIKDLDDTDYTIKEDVEVEVNLNENTIVGTIINRGDVVISGGDVESDAVGINNYGEATISDVSMKAGSTTDYSNIGRKDSVTEYNNVNIDSKGGGIGAVDGAKVIFNSGSVAVNSASTSGRYVFYAEGVGSEITINGGTFSFSKTLNQKRAYIYASADTTVYVKGGTFGPASTRSGYTAGIMGDGTVIITGGTFGFDPSTWVADGYEAVKSGNTWTVSAK